MGVIDAQVLDRVSALASVTTGDGEVLRRAALLEPDDRLIVELSLRNGVSRRQLGVLLQLAPGQVSRRLQSLGRRLHAPIVNKLLSPACPLRPEVRQIGVEHFLRGLSARKLADLHAMPRHRVTEIIRMLRAWHEGTLLEPRAKPGSSSSRAMSKPLSPHHPAPVSRRKTTRNHALPSPVARG